jgi:hypothetical protein
MGHVTHESCQPFPAKWPISAAIHYDLGSWENTCVEEYQGGSSSINRVLEYFLLFCYQATDDESK